MFGARKDNHESFLATFISILYVCLFHRLN